MGVHKRILSGKDIEEIVNGYVIVYYAMLYYAIVLSCLIDSCCLSCNLTAYWTAPLNLVTSPESIASSPYRMTDWPHLTISRIAGVETDWPPSSKTWRSAIEHPRGNDAHIRIRVYACRVYSWTTQTSISSLTSISKPLHLLEVLPILPFLLSCALSAFSTFFSPSHLSITYITSLH